MHGVQCVNWVSLENVSTQKKTVRKQTVFTTTILLLWLVFGIPVHAAWGFCNSTCWWSSSPWRGSAPRPVEPFRMVRKLTSKIARRIKESECQVSSFLHTYRNMTQSQTCYKVLLPGQAVVAREHKRAVPKLLLDFFWRHFHHATGIYHHCPSQFHNGLPRLQLCSMPPTPSSSTSLVQD